MVWTWVYIANLMGPPGDAAAMNRFTAIEAKNTQQDDRLNVLDLGKLNESDSRVPLNAGKESGLTHAFCDSNNFETWIGVRESDGGPTEYSEFHIRNRLGLHDSPGEYGGFVDDAFFYTELRFEKGTNQVPMDVLTAWGQRAGWGSGTGGGGGFATGDRYLDSAGNLQTAFPDTQNITGWGSSTMQLLAVPLGLALGDTGAAFHGEGRSAERVEHNTARIGSVPALLTVSGGSIPTSGAVTVTASNMLPLASMKPFLGTLNGISGTLSSTADTITFTRTVAGSAVTVAAGTPFVSTLGKESRNHVVLLNIGKNSLKDTGGATKVTTYTNNTFAWFSPMIKRVLVIGHFIDSNESPTGLQATEVLATNAALAARYGDLYFDLEGYLSSPQIWTDTGISPTSTDLQQQANRLKPDSLSADVGHMSAAANTAVANKIRAQLGALGWY